jgi:signal transduction histidine kinase
VTDAISHKIIANREIYVNNDTTSHKDTYVWTRPGPKPSAIAGLPLIAKEQAIGVLWVSRNTPIKQNELNLLTTLSEMAATTIHRGTLTQAEIKRRQEAEALAQATSALTQTLDLATLLDGILIRLERVVPFDSSAVFLIENNKLNIVTGRGLPDQEALIQHQYPLDGELFPVIQENREPMVILDASADSRFKRWGNTDYARGWLGVPLIAQDEVIGFISLDSKTANAYGEREATLAQAFANQAAAAIQNAQLLSQVQRHADELEQRVLDRTQELSVLFDVAAVASTPTDLKTTLEQVLSIVTSTLESTKGGIFLLNQKKDKLSMVSHIGLSEEMVAAFKTMELGNGIVSSVFQSGQFAISEDVSSDPRVEEQAKQFYFGPFAGFSLQIEGKIKGVIAVVRDGGQPVFSQDEINLLRSIADQVSSIIASAQLREQAESAAILEERQRLARDLHDAVSQTLFSASVIAQTLDRLWERGPDLVRQNLLELQKLTQGALAEMRNLLLELRPATLENTIMPDLLKQLGAGFTGRTKTEIEISILGQEKLPSEIHIAFFRLAQEGLNNIIKHARAQKVLLNYDSQPKQTRLTIQDDGLGFDINEQKPGHHGLTIMRERTTTIGANFEIISKPGEGTCLEIVWTPSNLN